MYPLYDNLKAFFSRYGLSYTEYSHDATDTCDKSAAMRQALGIAGEGSKNICFHAKGRYFLVTTLASYDFKARIFKRAFGSKDIRFADEQELSLQVGAPFGCVPPLGFCNEGLPLFVDERILSLEHFLFNPAIHTKTWQVSGETMRQAYASCKNPIYFFHINEDGTLSFTNRDGEVCFA